MARTIHRKGALGMAPIYCEARGHDEKCAFCRQHPHDDQGNRNLCTLPGAFIYSGSDAVMVNPMWSGSPDPYKEIRLQNKMDPKRSWILIPPDGVFKRHICWRVRWNEGGASMVADYEIWELAAKRWIAEMLENGEARLIRVVKTFTYRTQAERK